MIVLADITDTLVTSTTVNSGVLLSVIGLFVWLIRVDIPRRDAQCKEERNQMRADCRTELKLITETFERSLNRLEVRISANEMKREKP